MIRLFIFSLLTIVVALWVTLYLGFPADPGYLLIAFGNYTFETSLFALLVAMLVLYLLLRLLLVLLQAVNPGRFISYGRELSGRRKSSQRSHTMEGLLSFARGNWQSSYNLLTRAAGDRDASVINYLAAAHAAFELGQRDNWMQALEKAEVQYPHARSTINYTKAQLLFKSGQLEQSLAVLEQLKKKSLNDANLLSLLRQVYVNLEDWQKLKELLPVLEKNKLIDQEELEQVRLRIFMEELYAACDPRSADYDQQEARASLARLWKKAPPRYRDNEKTVRHYTDLLLRVNAPAEAAKVLESAISRNWSDSLVLKYGEQDYGNARQQLLVAEGWLQERPANASLLLSLGRICTRNELWGQAREYYEASIRISPSAEAYGELSRLLKHLGEAEASESYLQSYSDMIGTSLVELPMPASPKVTH